MAQFDVHRPRTGGEFAPYLVVMQSETLQALNTVVVAPMYSESAIAFTKKLHVKVEFHGAAYIVAPEHMLSLPRRALGSKEGSVAAARSELIDAVDLIFSGY